MDASEVYPDVLGDAVSHSSQRLAQMGSLVTAAAAMEVRRRAQASAVRAARGEQRNSGGCGSGRGPRGRWLGLGGRLRMTRGDWLRRICCRRLGGGVRVWGTPMLIRRRLVRCVGARSGCGCCIRMPWRGTTGFGVRAPERSRRCGGRCRCSGGRRICGPGTLRPSGASWRIRSGLIPETVLPSARTGRLSARPAVVLVATARQRSWRRRASRIAAEGVVAASSSRTLTDRRP